MTFTPGQTSKQINIVVKGDGQYEGDETFFLNLTAPANATLADGQGLGTITNDDGALILSKFAGAAEQLKPDAFLVNPYDIEQMADTVLTAFCMSQPDRSARMKRMRRNVRKENVFSWVDSFLKAGGKLAPRSLRLSEKRRSAAALQTQARNLT